ncbi:MAG: MFS transporter [Chloroflexota bacterium]|nr:MAG: MFS transporter [Chloroflexota bacterium]
MGATVRASEDRERLLTPSFGLICGVTAVTFFAFYLLLPTVPIYVKQIAGDESQVGLAFGVLTVSAVLIRLFAGRQSDRYGKKYFIVGGLLLSGVSTALYSVWPHMLPLYVLRFIHGAGWGMTTMAAGALVAELAPRSRRGEAMGYYGLFSNISLSFAPVVAAWVLVNQSIGAVFLVSAVLCGVAALGTLAMAEPRRIFVRLADPPPSALLSRKALFPSAVIFLLGISYASLMTFIPLFAQARHLGNEGLFFTVYAVVMLAARPLSGRLSDRFGRGVVVGPSLAIMAIAFGLLAVTWDQWTLAVVAVLTGVGFGGAHPSLMALAVDRSGENERGVAMGTFMAAFDLGIGIGAVVLGAVATAFGFGTMYAAAGLVGCVTLLAFVAPGRWVRRQR